MAEVAVHLTLATLPGDFRMFTIHIPDTIAIKEVKMKYLPPNWQEFPHPATTQRFGDEFVAANKYCVLKIPSVVTPTSYVLLVRF